MFVKTTLASNDINCRDPWTGKVDLSQNVNSEIKIT